MPDAPYSSNTIDAAERLPTGDAWPWLIEHAAASRARQELSENLSQELRHLVEELRSLRAADRNA